MSTETRSSSDQQALLEAELLHEAWKEQRATAVTSATGNLSLTETRWFPEHADEATAKELLDAEQAAADSDITVTPLQRRNIHTGAIEHGLRVWNANAPAIRAFERTETFPYNPDWVVEAAFTAVDAERTIPFEHIRDAGGTRELVVPGDITFERNGQRFTLSAFDDDGSLLLVFGDPTNGKQDESGTYGAGRFLFVERTESPDRVILDFNRAFVPPCGFSAQYNCPMPPPQNRLPWPVIAGERIPVFRDGFDIYDAI
ncbi:DUF1684 domain-containing protein [Leucobacter coleopterorum]|uniref:DUF1684 domain-containing protein n=1 Tax=Leucobacter coleopterorum TaxID=2714933 RepID=A0ABX6K1R8_9MICO|nr:DUF1684 domain-containing protein [Leucobacter coleopterorum]QIM19034.1 DUF1684 domain-containing protein [Leucobacter coleopterorum]